MIDFESLQMLIYQHVQQLTLLDYPSREAFRIAHQVAVLAFDEDFTRAGLAEAQAAAEGRSTKEVASSEGRPSRTSGLVADTNKKSKS